MKGISLWQPWASLVAFEEKRIETRGRRLFGNLIGKEIAILSTKTQPEFFEWSDQDLDVIDRVYPIVHAKARRDEWVNAFPNGCILCVCRVVFERPTEEVRDDLSNQELTFGNYGDGRYATGLELVHRLSNPLPAKGGQGIFELPQEAVERIVKNRDQKARDAERGI